MHDIVNLEARGIPTVAVVSDQFKSAASAQGKALGFEPAIILVEHPIQDRTDAEMATIAQAVTSEILQVLTANQAT